MYVLVHGFQKKCFVDEQEISKLVFYQVKIVVLHRFEQKQQIRLQKFSSRLTLIQPASEPPVIARIVSLVKSITSDRLVNAACHPILLKLAAILLMLTTYLTNREDSVISGC